MLCVIWKGVVSFGLVYILVFLLLVMVCKGIDFDWFDWCSMELVGYKWINKVIGEEIVGEDIVKGVKYEKNCYVVFSDEEIQVVYLVVIQIVDIIVFVEVIEIFLLYIDMFYYLVFENCGEKVYVLLCEVFKESGWVGLVNVVLYIKQYFVVVMLFGDVLVLNILCWGDEVCGVDEFGLIKVVIDVQFSLCEFDMVKWLIEDMSEKWDLVCYKDQFVVQIMEFVECKVCQGKLEIVGLVESEFGEGVDIVDLVELFRCSFGK